MPENSRTPTRILLSVLALALLSWAFWQAARTGYARTLAERAKTYASLDDEMAAADHAVALSPADAETRQVRGEIIQRSEDYQAAAQEFERAVALRPRDYYLWLLLGVARDQNNDQQGAMQALRQSEALAPAYAQAHWQLGNVLLRTGETEQAFVELRKSATTDPSLLPNLIDLAWGVFDHDPQAIVSKLRPGTDAERLALAKFFAQHNQGPQAAVQFLAVKAASGPRAEEVLSQLMRARDFRNAYRVWAHEHGLSNEDPGATIRDGDFENQIEVGPADFGWQVTPDIANATMSVDTSEHQSGSRSLRLEFHGNSDPSQPLLTQIVLVKPETHYRLSFASQVREFTSAAAPIVTVSDAADPRIIFGQSSALRSQSNGWSVSAFDFATGKATQAIVIGIAREHCPANPCPAFGVTWLDSFALEAR